MRNFAFMRGRFRLKPVLHSRISSLLATNFVKFGNSSFRAWSEFKGKTNVGWKLSTIRTEEQISSAIINVQYRVVSSVVDHYHIICCLKKWVYKTTPNTYNAGLLLNIKLSVVLVTATGLTGSKNRIYIMTSTTIQILNEIPDYTVFTD